MKPCGLISGDAVYKSAMIPKMLNQADSVGVKVEIQQPRSSVSEKECGVWRNQVNEVLNSTSSTQNMSMFTQTFKNNYQFMDKDFKRLGMDPNLNVYVKEVCSMMGRKEPKFDKRSMAYKTLTSSNTMFRKIAFMRMKIEAGRKLQGTKKTEKGGTREENIVPMFFKVLDKASQDICLVTAHLHGISLRKVGAKS